MNGIILLFSAGMALLYGLVLNRLCRRLGVAA